jgi:hypothetical protein
MPAIVSRLQLALVALFSAVIVLIAVIGLLISEPEDRTKRWIFLASLAWAVVGATVGLAAAVRRARRIAWTVATAREMAAFARAPEETSDSTQSAIDAWARDAPRYLDMLLRADAYASAAELQKHRLEVVRRRGLPLDLLTFPLKEPPR